MARSVVETQTTVLIVDEEIHREVVISYRGPKGDDGADGLPGEGIETYSTVAELEATTDPSGIAYVTETSTFYEYSSSLDRVADHLRYLDTANGGASLWFGVSGPYSAIVPLVQEDGTLVLTDEGLMIYTLYRQV